tara:strand:- start:3000 stop:3530 length:531 start_codon:yes stop_codon:yes gene_type:complete
MKFYIINFFKSALIIFIGFIFFLLIYFLKRKILPSEIIYNEGVIISILSAIIFSLPIFYKKLESCYYILILTFLINYSFIATFPTLIDRSISIMILNNIASNKKMNIRQIKDSFEINYSQYKNYYQVDKRLKEQLVLKNIYLDSSDQYNLTDKGKKFIKLTNFLKKIFNLKVSYKY